MKQLGKVTTPLNENISTLRMLWTTKHTKGTQSCKKTSQVRWYSVITALRSTEAKRIFSRPGLHEAAKTNIRQSQNKIHNPAHHLVDFRILAKRKSDSKICTTKIQRDTLIYAK